MARIFGALRPDATYGERKVFELLSQLSDDYWVWPELSIGEKYPDFVVLEPRLGLVVLEVKDWVEIIEATASRVVVRTRDGTERSENNPLHAAREKAIAISSRLERRPSLLHSIGPQQGKLKLPWTYAVVFSNLTRMFIFTLDEIFEPAYLFAEDDLYPARFEKRLRVLDWRFPTQLDASEMEEVRAALDPVLIVRNGQNGREVGVADMLQEQVAKEGLFAPLATDLDDDVTLEGRQIATKMSVRLVRGVAGSGKTLVLAMRARYLAEAYPDWQILVTTFNKALAEDLAVRLDGVSEQITVNHFHALCAEWLRSIGVWQNGPVDDTQGQLANLLQREFASITQFDAPFLAGEIAWIKDQGISSEGRYLEVGRLGRGKRLPRRERSQVYTIFQRYEQKLRDRRRFDWSDVPLLLLRAVRDGDLTLPAYHAILVDEAQDFAPTWFDVLRAATHPETRNMFLAADSTQRIYRNFSWRSMGLHVVGRTRILPRSYRSTYQIMRAASVVVQGNPELTALMAEEEEEPLDVELDPRWMRHGEQPELRRCASRADEIALISRHINRLIVQGYQPGEIAVLHAKKFGPATYRSELRSAGTTGVIMEHESRSRWDAVQFATIHAVKGLEYRAVFLAQAQLLFDSDEPIPYSDRAKFIADQLRLFFVAMTRARDRLVITYQNRLPRELQVLDEHLRHSSID